MPAVAPGATSGAAPGWVCPFASGSSIGSVVGRAAPASPVAASCPCRWFDSQVEQAARGNDKKPAGSMMTVDGGTSRR